jgi:hypothetical protein
MPEVRRARLQLLTSGVGVEKLGTNQLNFMRSVWHSEAFSGIV